MTKYEMLCFILFFSLSSIALGEESYSGGVSKYPNPPPMSEYPMSLVPVKKEINLNVIPSGTIIEIDKSTQIKRELISCYSFEFAGGILFPSSLARDDGSVLDLKIEHYSKDSCYGASYILNYENSKIEGDFCIRTPRTEKAFIDTIDSVNGKFARQKINKDKDAFWKERVEHKDLKLNICVYEEIAISDKEKSRQICQKGEVIKTISLAVSKSKIDEVNLLTVVPVSSIAICP